MFEANWQIFLVQSNEYPGRAYFFPVFGYTIVSYQWNNYFLPGRMEMSSCPDQILGKIIYGEWFWIFNGSESFMMGNILTFPISASSFVSHLNMDRALVQKECTLYFH